MRATVCNKHCCWVKTKNRKQNIQTPTHILWIVLVQDRSKRYAPRAHLIHFIHTNTHLCTHFTSAIWIRKHRLNTTSAFFDTLRAKTNKNLHTLFFRNYVINMLLTDGRIWRILFIFLFSSIRKSLDAFLFGKIKFYSIILNNVYQPYKSASFVLVVDYNENI